MKYILSFILKTIAMIIVFIILEIILRILAVIFLILFRIILDIICLIWYFKLTNKVIEINNAIIYNLKCLVEKSVIEFFKKELKEIKKLTK